MIQDKLGYGYFRGVLGFTNQITLMATLFRLQICSLPIGVDRLCGERSRSLANNVLNRFSKLTFRDSVSRELTGRYGVPVNEVFELPDPAFDIDKYIEREVRSDDYAVISLVRENVNLNNFSTAIKGYVEYLLKNTHLNIRLLCMDTRYSDEYMVYKELFKSIDTKRINIVVEEDLKKVCNLIWNSHHTIAMRLHTMIIGLGYTPIFCISRTTKTDTFCCENEVALSDVDSQLNENELIAFYEEVSLKRDQMLRRSLEKRQYSQNIRIENCL